ncbi:glycogen debranching N-terminal domain-containing protein [Paradesertivirga mongoliensis]|uniref:Glycogen debranching N-terminal domain-containing protein n=1 Tax=Paradesertivirga mongoliensis TaxID=2100740 RepID=A0ABW4ZPG8_9SPHI|nr:amylo-alpha-1,6-glucosidase [Pedobacter mongoliensis]
MQTEESLMEEDKFHISPDAVNADDRINILNHSNTFGIFDRWGNIYPNGKMVQGIYHDGTRYINKLVLTINGQKPLLLSSNIKEDNDILSVDLTNPALTSCNLPDNTVHISRKLFVRDGAFYEEIDCSHYGNTECTFNLELSFDGDFKDIFEIRGIQRYVAKNKVKYCDAGQECMMEYDGLDGIKRTSAFEITTDADYSIKKNKILFTINLRAQKPVKIIYSLRFLSGGDKSKDISYSEAKSLIEKERNTTSILFAEVDTSNEQFNHWINRSKADLLSLLAQTETGKYPYAGVPWYNTPFGRDGIITGIETLWLIPEISRDVLLFLASKQATELIPEKDAEPGKILHEARTGEMANTGEVPFKEYYGTIDATPLFVMLAGMYYERTADLEFIKRLWPNIKAALAWIDNYGDLDGDGFVEYEHKAKNGLTNQGWKDSYDSVMDESGELAETPIALCEVQGYVFAAKQHASKLALLLNEQDFGERLSKEAGDLKHNFNEKFWDDGLSCYVLALDGQKKPCKVISSNAGHCLFTGIADKDKARKLADTLLSGDMFSGWGIRTLSSSEKRYNPMSYHNGSIWPHDNALIAYGLARYGFREHVLKLTEAIFQASLFIELHRLPELYCGFERRHSEGPTLYPVACSPQAWSVAVVFMLLQACFQIEIDAPSKTISFNRPVLPEYLGQVSISNLALDNGTCGLLFNRHHNDVSFNLLQKPDDWDILIKK